MFELKFKVRVKHFAKDKYTVDYANYRFFKNWKSLNFWFSCGYFSGLECWSTNLFTIEEAEALAASIHSMEDVHKYYEPERKKCIEFAKAKNEAWAKKAPYSSKEFK